MRKIIVLLMLCLFSGVLFAQSPGSTTLDMREAIERLKQSNTRVNNKKMEQAIKEAAEATSAANGEQKTLEITMGKNKFVLEKAVKEKADGKDFWTYYYVPAKKPLVYKEDVIFSSALEGADYEVTGRESSLLVVGPKMWRKVDFQVSGIEIVIYEDTTLEQIVAEWEERFTKDCVYYSEKRHAKAWRMGGLWHTPTKAYMLEDGRTAVVYVDASSDVYGPYKRACSKWGLDRLFKDQPHFEKVDVADLPQTEYDACTDAVKNQNAAVSCNTKKESRVHQFTSTATSK